jgi:hypothetical protein
MLSTLFDREKRNRRKNVAVGDTNEKKLYFIMRYITKPGDDE